MRPTYNALWIVEAVDADLVTTAHGSDGSTEDNARAAAALVQARPEVAAELAVEGKEPAEVVKVAADSALVEADAVVAAGRRAAEAVGLELSSVSASVSDRERLEFAGGAVPGLLVVLLDGGDPEPLRKLGATVVVHVYPPEPVDEAAVLRAEVDDLRARLAALENAGGGAQ
jgi:hypothetical protein